MEVILKKDVDGLGKYGELKIVKNGYARNFLIPNNLAVMADDKSKEEIEKERAKYESQRTEKQKLAEKNKDVIEKVKLNFEVKAIDGKMFGSVTNKNVAERLTETTKINVEKKDVEFETAHQTGQFKALIKLGDGIKAEVLVEVVSKEAFEKEVESKKKKE